jgi:catechol 2,3-dioxygenase-like lactoylglutathione lyase family enzyme
MKLGYIILYVPDVAATVAFYENAFGLECRFQHNADGQAYAELATGDTVLAFASESLADSHGFGYRKTNPESSPPSVEIALVTDGVQSAFDKALAAGASEVKRPVDQPWGQTVSYLRDNNGYLVEVCSPVQAAE